MAGWYSYSHNGHLMTGSSKYQNGKSIGYAECKNFQYGDVIYFWGWLFVCPYFKSSNCSVTFQISALHLYKYLF